MPKKERRQSLSSPHIICVQYTNPAGYPPLEHISHILAQEGWDVTFLGTGAQGADALRFPCHEHILVRQLPFCQAGWRQKVHYFWFCVWVIVWTLRRRPVWVYASDPLSCPVGLLLSYLPGLRVIYHEHDSPDITETGVKHSSRSLFMRLVLWSRRQLARRAASCILPNQQRSEHFADNVSKNCPVLTIWNCPRLEEVAGPRKASIERGLRVLYHGSIVPSRLPSSVLEALTKLPEQVQLTVIGYETVGHRGYVQELQEIACRLGICRRIHFIDAMSRHELMLHCQQCDVGLAFMPKSSADINLQFMVGASNKPFDYLACGLALLVSDLPDWREMYVEPGYGLACNPEDPASIAAALGWFLEHPTEMRVMGERGRQRITNEWNYERQFEPVLQVLSGNSR